MPPPDLIVVGAGLTGLACALRARSLGLEPLVLEASDGVGGRVRTDVLDGFRLDRGFQVLPTAYPALEPYLPHLDLRPFLAGARVRWRDGFHGLFDPRRHAWKALRGAFGGPGGWKERARMLRLAREARDADPEALLDAGGGTSAQALDAAGVTQELRAAFVQPWLAGIFLERPLATPAAWMRYVLHVFARGVAALPARGIGALPEHMTGLLPPGTVRLGARVTRVESGAVVVDGTRVTARAVVVAAALPDAQALLGRPVRAVGRSVMCHYFAADADPLGGEPVLVLDGEGSGPVHHVCVPSAVSAALAPAGAALISVTSLGVSVDEDATLAAAVRAQLGGWFGAPVAAWRHLRTYRIPYALPAPAIASTRAPEAAAPGVWVAGDHRETASIQGALTSGTRAAEAVHAALTETADVRRT